MTIINNVLSGFTRNLVLNTLIHRLVHTLVFVITVRSKMSDLRLFECVSFHNWTSISHVNNQCQLRNHTDHTLR